MLKKIAVREECLYCHGHEKLGKSCPFCGDVRQAESPNHYPSMRATSMLNQTRQIFEPWISGV
jgi:hypothetical protein